MKQRFIVCLLFFTSFAFSQGEANIWYFGLYAGLDFNSGVPVALTNSQMDAHSGCAVLSNAAGQLLFYTNGETIWNRNQQQMSNGTNLQGTRFSTQSATIVQKPGSPNLYYVFTINQTQGINGFYYSIIDLSLDNGLGAVTIKNVLIYTPTCEKVSIVKHTNGVDFWVVTHGFNNTFYSHLVTPAGISNTPVITNIGFDLSAYIFGSPASQGYLKLSPDGTKLAICHSNFLEVEILDFNATTGVISNPQMLYKGATINNNSVYGAEFSPNSKILYITCFNSGVIFQFDLTASNIASSKINLQTGDNSLGALQLGPDRKIYVSPNYSTKLSVINNPNALGLGCNFQNHSIDLGVNHSAFGLPTFNQSFFFKTEMEFQNTCEGSDTSITLTASQAITSAAWDFGDGTTSAAINPTHRYTAAGTYTISVTVTGTNGKSVKTRDIVISKTPTATKPQDLLVCDTNNDGLNNFDLTTQNTAILNGQDPNLVTIKYFANATDYANKTAIVTPNNYTNTTPYQLQTIIAEVSNNANSECKSTTSFDIDVFDTPKPNTVVPKISSCDNTSVGTDADGRLLFDLTQRSTTILNGQSAIQFVLSYYKDAALTQLIATPTTYANTTSPETIYVKMVNKDNASCIATTSFPIEVLALPVITSVVSLKQCDDNIDGFSVFNLEEAIDKITANAANETIVFYKFLADAQNDIARITTPTTYTNQVVSNDAVYARVTYQRQWVLSDCKSQFIGFDYSNSVELCKDFHRM